MDAFAPFADRVCGGDQYSWTAVTLTFLHHFGGGEEDKPDVIAA